MAIAVSIPPEDNAAISRYAQLALELQRLEEDEVKNLENNEQMIMRDGKIAIMMQQQEEDKGHKSTEKEQRAMTSTPVGKALLLVHCVISLHHFLKSATPQNLGFASKVATLAMDSMFSSRIVYSIYKQYLELLENATVDVG